MDLVVSPTAVALNPQQGAAAPVFKAGDVIEAQVLALLGDGAATLAIGNTVIDVKTQVPLTAGTTVRLAVKSTPDGIRLSLIGNGGAPSPAPAGATAAPGARPAPNATLPSPDTPARPSVPPSAVPMSPEGMMASSNPRAAAAPPAPMPAAAGPAQPDSPATQIAISTATQNSTNPGSSPSVAASPASPTAVPVVPELQGEMAPPTAMSAGVALSLAVQNAAAAQKGLAPLFADARVAATTTSLPEPVRQAAERLVALQPTLDATVSGASLKRALGRSGLFLEAHMAAEANGGAATPAPTQDIKAAMIVLRNVLKLWLAGTTPAAPMPPSGGTPEDAPLAPSIVPGSAPSQVTGSAQPAEARAAVPLPPPYRGAPTAGQPPVVASISPDMPPREIGKVLLSETNGALARETLLQAASLPDQPAPTQHGDASGPRWLFEVPFATPQGTAVAQFEIARDGRNAPAEGVKPAWRARFSLDLEPIGPVHAQIALVGSRTTVTLWAERPATSSQLRDNAPSLAEALRQAELEPGELLVRFGTPPRPRDTIASGHFLDRAS